LTETLTDWVTEPDADWLTVSSCFRIRVVSKRVLYVVFTQLIWFNAHWQSNSVFRVFIMLIDKFLTVSSSIQYPCQ
jgi:hypothetical protein